MAVATAPVACGIKPRAAGRREERAPTNQVLLPRYEPRDALVVSVVVSACGRTGCGAVGLEQAATAAARASASRVSLWRAIWSSRRLGTAIVYRKLGSPEFWEMRIF